MESLYRFENSVRRDVKSGMLITVVVAAAEK